MSHLTTHILDATAGVPATGVAVTLAGPDGVAVASGQTDADGRLVVRFESTGSGWWRATLIVFAVVYALLLIPVRRKVTAR